MAMIPTMMASTPSRINEVDDDLSTDVGRGVDVDVDMAGGPFVRLGFSLRLSWVRGCGFRPSGMKGLSRESLPPASISRLAQVRKGANTSAGQAVTSASSTGQRGNGCLGGEQARPGPNRNSTCVQLPASAGAGGR